MKVILGGVRGTGCIAQPDFMKYGGETTSVLVEGEKGERIVLDAGTGARKLGQHLETQEAAGPILLLLTHYHLDHVVGLPSFGPLYRESFEVKVASPAHDGRAPKEVLSQLIAEPFWPVRLEDLHAKVDFLPWKDEASSSPFRLGGLDVRWCPVHHPGGCTAYRIDEPATKRAFVFATDIEWDASTPAERDAFLALCSEPRPASLLVFDGQFARENYGPFAGWGHSTWEDAVDVARASKAGLLLVTHHAPQSNDEHLDRVDNEVSRALNSAKLARDGMEVVL